jgi:electron transport complex protein RnfG
MNSTVKTSLMAALILGAFSVVGTGLVKLTDENTKDQIAANERAALLRSLSAMVSSNLYNNDIVADTLELEVPVLGGKEAITLYRARKSGHPVAVVFTTIAPDGYSGKIKLLVAVDTDGTILGVRVVAHKETPGLGDAIELTRSNWILGFTGKSLVDMSEKQWAVNKDGGDFDQFTGATITPRAVVKAVKNTLLYFHGNPAQLFSKFKPQQ